VKAATQGKLAVLNKKIVSNSEMWAVHTRLKIICEIKQQK
jgi:hypothetical protein